MSEDRSITAQLKAQVRDLQQSLKINKELMQNVLLEGITDQSVKDLIQRLEKENSRLSVALNKEHKEKIQLYEAIKKRKEELDKDHELMKDKEKKFESYLKNFRKDLDERKRYYIIANRASGANGIAGACCPVKICFIVHLSQKFRLHV